MGVPFDMFLSRYQEAIAHLSPAEQLQAVEDFADAIFQKLPGGFLKVLRDALANGDMPVNFTPVQSDAMLAIAEGHLALRHMGLINDPVG
jgi:hypothetical protein